MHNLYNIPIIQQDLREEDTIIHIANALEYLNNVVSDIFDRIDKRIKENKERTEAIENRVKTANTKINKLIGTNKATKVYSCTKYPANNIHQDTRTIFSKSTSDFRCEKHISTNSKPLKYDDNKLQDKLQFYHVKAAEKVKRNIFDLTPDEGLGNIPNDLRSVTSLLLYNTQENPYKRYVFLDPLNLTKRSSNSSKPTTEPVSMDAAPLSITNRTSISRNYADNYFYSPGIGEVPQIDVPIDLPDLPGIADDINYDLEPGPAIAPSVATTPALVDLPILSDLPVTQDVQTPSELPAIQLISQTDFPDILGSKPQACIVKTDDVVTVRTDAPPQPPPPPPPPSAVTPVASNVSLPIAPVMPPPPPPPKLPEVTPVPVAMPVVPDVRANLMEAIRQAGGAGRAKLKASSAVEQKEKPAAAGGNLMADLHAKLLMRRKGISGAKPEIDAAGGVMGKISAMIPAPPKLDSKPETDGDSEWE